MKLSCAAGVTEILGADESLESWRQELTGRPLQVVRDALASRATSSGAPLTEPDLTRIAVLISGGKRFRVQPNGDLVIED